MSKIQELHITSINRVHQFGVDSGMFRSTLDEGVMIITTSRSDWYLYKTETLHDFGEDSEDSENMIMVSVYMASRVHPLSSKFDADADETGYAMTSVAAAKHILMEDLNDYLDEEIHKIIPEKTLKTESDGFNRLIQGLIDDVNVKVIVLEAEEEAATEKVIH